MKTAWQIWNQPDFFIGFIFSIPRNLVCLIHWKSQTCAETTAGAAVATFTAAAAGGIWVYISYTRLVFNTAVCLNTIDRPIVKTK